MRRAWQPTHCCGWISVAPPVSGVTDITAVGRGSVPLTLAQYLLFPAFLRRGEVRDTTGGAGWPAMKISTCRWATKFGIMVLSEVSGPRRNRPGDVAPDVTSIDPTCSGPDHELGVSIELHAQDNAEARAAPVEAFDRRQRRRRGPRAAAHRSLRRVARAAAWHGDAGGAGRHGGLGKILIAGVGARAPLADRDLDIWITCPRALRRRQHLDARQPPRLLDRRLRVVEVPDCPPGVHTKDVERRLG